ncbi:MAG: phasin family protein [Thermodesulfovibrionales bacterium]|jgi:polyhydroxyalkanoate synthesis regulator phasin
MTIFDVMKNAILAGYGVQEKMKEFIDDLVKKGELSESQGAKMAKEWMDRADKTTEDMTKGISETISKSLDRINFATREDMEKIQKAIEGLSARVKNLEAAQAAPSSADVRMPGDSCEE